jgi:hypothetical protein
MSNVYVYVFVFPPPLLLLLLLLLLLRHVVLFIAAGRGEERGHAVLLAHAGLDRRGPGRGAAGARGVRGGGGATRLAAAAPAQVRKEGREREGERAEQSRAFSSCLPWRLYMCCLLFMSFISM